MSVAIDFQIVARDGEARAGVLVTRRGVIDTPVFMPVGTAGSVKGMRFEALESTDLNVQVILSNTYHLLLRPGMETIRMCGGIHSFIGWNRSLLSDSGGYQVWSLGDLREVSEKGVTFRSHMDGSLCFLSPEISMAAQATLGSDIVMAFDECLPGDTGHEPARQSLLLTSRWAARSRRSFDDLQAREADIGAIPGTSRLSGAQALFGIVQGAAHLDLRRESLSRTTEIGFDGYALGGLSVGERKSIMYDVVEAVAPIMPELQPRYLMGVGSPVDLVESIARGVDMFDCVLPTRNARNGQAFTSRGKLNIRNSRFSRDMRALDPSCACSVCSRHSRAFLRHLHVSGEMLAGMLLSHHNLAFFLDTMKRVRQAILSGVFTRFRREFTERWSAGVD